MRYLSIPVTPYEQNCTLLWCEKTREAAVVDPGGDIDRVLKAAEREGLTLTKILITHGHIDHAGAAADLAEQCKLPIEGPQKEDAFWIDGLSQQSQRFGFPHAKSFTPTRWLEEGDTVSFGEETLQVFHCPGHTPGHVVFYHAPSKLALVGDVLFQGSIGRTDFPRGNHQDLINSIQKKLFPLGDDIEFVSGHGPNSTFGDERRFNPYCGGV